MRKKINIVLCLLLILVSTTGFSNALDTNQEYLDYLGLVEEHVLASDVSFEEWCKFLENEKSWEKSLNDSEEFMLVYDSTNAGTYGAVVPYSMQKGDIFITNGTASSAILGHAGIAVSSAAIIHTAGKGEVPALISLNNWNLKYTNEESDTWTKIYRHTSSSVATQAGNWAYNTYYNSGATYQISTNHQSTDTTYCSKLVWQAYYYGPSSPCASIPSGIISPYNVPSLVHNNSQVFTYFSAN